MWFSEDSPPAQVIRTESSGPRRGRDEPRGRGHTFGGGGDKYRGPGGRPGGSPASGDRAGEESDVIVTERGLQGSHGALTEQRLEMGSPCGPLAPGGAGGALAHARERPTASGRPRGNASGWKAARPRPILVPLRARVGPSGCACTPNPPRTELPRPMAPSFPDGRRLPQGHAEMLFRERPFEPGARGPSTWREDTGRGARASPQEPMASVAIGREATGSTESERHWTSSLASLLQLRRQRGPSAWFGWVSSSQRCTVLTRSQCF